MRINGEKLSSDNTEPTTRIPDCFSLLPEITVLRSQVLVHDFYSREHTNVSHEIMLLRRGQMTLKTDSGQWLARVGDLLLLERNQRHADIFPRNAVVEIFFLHFKWAENCAREFFRVVNNDHLPLVSQRARLEVEQQLHTLEASAVTHYNALLCASRLHLILMILYNDLVDNQAESSSTLHKRNLVNMAEDYIIAHLGENLSLDNIASYLNVSKFHLARTFREATGTTLHNRLTSMRMKRAQEFLDEGRMFLPEIAAAVGFQDVSYFSKVFKKHYNYSPTLRIRHFRK